MNIEINGRVLSVRPWDKNIFRVTCRMVGGAETPSVLGVEAREGRALLYSAAELVTEYFGAKLDPKSGRLTCSTPNGEEILNMPFPEFEPVPVIKYKHTGETGESRTEKTANGEINVNGAILQAYEERTAYRAKIFFDWKDGEILHGLGQAEEGVYNLRGQTQYLYPHNMRIPVPFLVSGAGYAVLFDCGCLMTFNDNAHGSYVLLDTVDELDFYVIVGDCGAALDGFRRLTGKAALLPKWAFGFIQSKEAYRSQAELLDIAREYRRRKIPLDCLVNDWDSWEQGKWGNKRLDKTNYPDMAQGNKELREMGVHSMISIWPNFSDSADDHIEMKENGFLLLDGSTYDAFNEDARALYFEQAKRELFDAFDSWWCDSVEPFASPDWNGAFLREPWERYNIVGEEHKKYIDPTKACLYGMAHAQGLYENQREYTSERRVLNLTRAGHAGSQKYGVVVWSGDITADWATMRKQIAEGLNMSLSGLPWWTLDIGGFFVVREAWQKRGCGQNKNPNPLWFWRGQFNDGVGDLGYRELYTRWMQLGAFLPLFRSHGTDTPREIWRFGEKGTPYYDAIEKAIRLRYKLMPYIYSSAANVVFKNEAIMRGLCFDFPNDKTAAALDDEYMFGENILVCPVTEPLGYAPDSVKLDKPFVRKCYLPQGADWYDFYTGESYRGGAWVNADAALDKIPLFVKAGSVIPSETASLDYAAQETKEPLEIRVYPGADCAFTLYEDAGDGYEYESGVCNKINIVWNERASALTIGASERKFPQSLAGRGCVIRVGNRERAVNYDGEEVKAVIDLFGN